ADAATVQVGDKLGHVAGHQVPLEVFPVVAGDVEMSVENAAPRFGLGLAGEGRGDELGEGDDAGPDYIAAMDMGHDWSPTVLIPILPPTSAEVRRRPERDQDRTSRSTARSRRPAIRSGIRSL